LSTEINLFLLWYKEDITSQRYLIGDNHVQDGTYSMNAGKEKFPQSFVKQPLNQETILENCSQLILVQI